jgi:hypothetical protein
MSEMTINALAPWFGNCRKNSERIGIELGDLDWCGVPCVGGAPELPKIKTRGGVASDLHRHIINLARVVKDRALFLQLVQYLEGILFHPDELALAQYRCRLRSEAIKGCLFAPQAGSLQPDVQWAADYFIACWMGRGGHAGKKTEFSQSLSLRYTSSGGDSAKRFQSAIASLPAWHRALTPWSFDLCDIFDFLSRVVDRPGHGLYVDAPWPDAGEEYLHPFTDAQHVRLCDRLRQFKHLRIVIRYGDHPFIRELYAPAAITQGWTLSRQSSRTQTGGSCEELLILNGPSFLGEMS